MANGNGNGNGKPKSFGDKYATMMIGVFCTLGSAVYITQLPFQYPFAHKAQVAALQTQVNENKEQTQQAAAQASTAVTVAKEAKRSNGTSEWMEWRRETDHRQSADRADINRIKKKLGMP